MIEFPAHIWALAVCAFPDAKSPHTSKERVATAILGAVAAERERCARIADPLPIEADDSDIEKQAHDIRMTIADTIRGL